MVHVSLPGPKLRIISIQLYQNDTSKIKQARLISRVPQDVSSPVFGRTSRPICQSLGSECLFSTYSGATPSFVGGWPEIDVTLFQHSLKSEMPKTFSRP